MSALFKLKFFQELAKCIGDNDTLMFAPINLLPEGDAPDEALPEGAKLLDIMPEPLINFYLYLIECEADLKTESLTFARNCVNLSDDEIKDGYKEMNIKEETLRERHEFFWKILQAEFLLPDHKDGINIGFTKDFRVYIRP